MANKDEFDFEESSPMMAAAVSMHELYETLKAAGFSRRDALELVTRVLTSAVSEAINGSIQDGEDGDD